jgi:hypothetical protein
MNVRLALAILVTSSIASADGSAYDVGFRVGGYGFRREGDNSAGSWTLCRMNGFGLFGSHDLTGPLFLEAGLDAYFSSNVVLSGQSTDLPIDRASGLASVAIGARTYLAPWARAYVQLGAGVELTRVSVPYETGDRIRADKVMPEGFFGIGMDLRIMRGTYIGASFRLLAMGNFDYDPQKLEMTDPWTSKPNADQVFAASPSMATQGQFYVRRDL